MACFGKRDFPLTRHPYDKTGIHHCGIKHLAIELASSLILQIVFDFILNFSIIQFWK